MIDWSTSLLEYDSISNIKANPDIRTSEQIYIGKDLIIPKSEFNGNVFYPAKEKELELVTIYEKKIGGNGFYAGCTLKLEKYIWR